MSEHTPGPWEIREGAEEVYGTAIYEVGAHDLHPLAAVQNEADARLIAAAPNLLEALESAHGILQMNLGDTDPHVRSACDLMWAAIAKAKGIES